MAGPGNHFDLHRGSGPAEHGFSAAARSGACARAVVAPDGGPLNSASIFLKDRMFLGYQEKADILEVISYNEGAARFEFQVVTDYRAGGTPQVMYANRTLCVACHQNAARPLWVET